MKNILHLSIATPESRNVEGLTRIKVLVSNYVIYCFMCYCYMEKLVHYMLRLKPPLGQSPASTSIKLYTCTTLGPYCLQRPRASDKLYLLWPSSSGYNAVDHLRDICTLNDLLPPLLPRNFYKTLSVSVYEVMKSMWKMNMNNLKN